jgi:hypothetical protein
MLCHCLECRKVSGSAFTTNLVVPKTAFKITGEVKEYRFVQEMGGEWELHFCPTCGSNLYRTTTRGDLSTVVAVEGGTLSKEAFGDIKPDEEIFAKYRASWLGASPETVLVEAQACKVVEPAA